MEWGIGEIVKYFRPIIIRQDKKINDLRQQIFETDKKLEGIKYKVVYKTKKGFICPVCGKDMEDEIYENLLHGSEETLTKFKRNKKLIEKR